LLAAKSATGNKNHCKGLKNFLSDSQFI